MIPAQFDYLAPTTVEEALAALAEHGDEAKILAGGQSLLPVLRMRLNAPEMIIDLNKIESMRGVREDGAGIGLDDSDGVGISCSSPEVSRSPEQAVSTTARPYAAPSSGEVSNSVAKKIAPERAQAAAEPAKPSQDFLGDTDGAIGCLPSSTPAT